MNIVGGANLESSVPSDNGLLRLVVDSMNEGFGLLAPDFTILELNTEAMRIDTRAREDVIGRSHWAAYPRTEHDEVGELYKRAMAERVSVALEHRYKWQDGRTSWFETRAFPVENGCLAVFFRDITERHLAKQRLSAGERRFTAAIAAIDGVLWTNNAAGEMTGEQPGWAALTGQALADYQGQGWLAAVHPDDAQPTIAAWGSAVAAKSTFEFEHRVRRHDGRYRLFAVRAAPMLDASGATEEWVGIHRDVTDTRADALRLNQLAETMDAVFYVHEIDERRISYVSRAYEDIWGRPREELYADETTFLTSVHVEDRPRLEAFIRQRPEESSAEIEYRLMQGADRERVIHDRSFVTRDPLTGLRRVVGIATDVTTHRRNEELLARNAETFAHLVVSNPFGIYVIDANFKLMSISQGAQRVFAGIDPLLGRDFAELLQILWTEPFASEATAIFRHTLATGEPFVSPSTVEQRASGDIEAYDWRTERITLPDGRYGVVCYFYDLSERNAQEARLRQALADKDLLAREIDHRVKNSLAIVGSLLSMQRSNSRSETIRAALDDVAARVMAVARVHERLHRSDQLGVVAFGAYLEDLCHDLASSMSGQDVEIECKAVPLDLPAQTAMSLALIANELVTNAFKHGGASGGTKIVLNLAVNAGLVTLTVVDDGTGIPASINSRASSMGMGMKMVSALARQVKAEITLPKPGEPAKFVVTMRLADLDAPL